MRQFSFTDTQSQAGINIVAIIQTQVFLIPKSVLLNTAVP